MSRPLLPPRGLFTGTRWLFDPALSAPIKETLLQIMALSWGRPGHTTPALSYPQLEELTGKPARTLRGHFLALRTYHAALRLQRAGAGQFIVALADWLFQNSAPLAAAGAWEAGELLQDDALPGKFLPQPFNDQEEQEEIPPYGVALLPPPLDDHDPQPIPAKRASPARSPSRVKPAGAPASSAPLAAPKKLTQALQKRLLEAGVFPALLPEVEARAAQWQYTAPEIGRLLDWSADDEPQKPAGLFISRLRAGARAPALYAKPACPQCGKRAAHASDCTRRYLEGF